VTDDRVDSLPIFDVRETLFFAALAGGRVLAYLSDSVKKAHSGFRLLCSLLYGS